MKFWQAMRALEEGDKVRCTSWPENGWISSKGDEEGTFNIYLHLATIVSQEWEFYEGANPPLSFAQVIKGLKEGKIFKRPGWHSDIFLIMKHPSTEVVLENSSYHTLLMADFEATDWIETKR